MGPDSRQGLEPFSAVAFKAGKLVNDNHIKWPVVLIVVHQPDNVLPVDDVHICRRIQRPDALRRTPQDRREPQMLQVIPLRGFPLPGGFGYFFRRDDQDTANLEAAVLQFIDRSQRDGCLAQAHVQEQPDGRLLG